jgi:hypothetical protein
MYRTVYLFGRFPSVSSREVYFTETALLAHRTAHTMPLSAFELVISRLAGQGQGDPVQFMCVQQSQVGNDCSDLIFAYS